MLNKHLLKQNTQLQSFGDAHTCMSPVVHLSLQQHLTVLQGHELGTLTPSLELWHLVGVPRGSRTYASNSKKLTEEASQHFSRGGVQQWEAIKTACLTWLHLLRLPVLTPGGHWGSKPNETMRRSGLGLSRTRTKPPDPGRGCSCPGSLSLRD